MKLVEAYLYMFKDCILNRYRIDAVTMKGEKGTTYRLSEVGDILEGVYRSVNNLLEKFHQSFFFYILPCTYRYVSIGVYMPPIALMAAAGLIQISFSTLKCHLLL